MRNFALSGNWDSFLAELMQRIEDFFNPTLSGYTNLDFGSDNIINIHVIVFGIFIGVMIAAVYSIYTKNILGAFVRNMLERGAIDPENAMTLEELGYTKNTAVTSALKGYTLGRVVRSIEKDEFIKETNKSRAIYEENRKKSDKHGKKLPPFREPKFNKNVRECRYYIPEKDRYTAEMRFNATGSGYITFFFVLLVAVICVIIVYALLPHILAFVDTSLSSFTVEGNTYRPSGTIIK